MQINLFTPAKFKKQTLDIEYLDNMTLKKWQYSASGRASIYHILKDLEIESILVPAYICSTVLEPLKKLNLKPIFYDLDLEDLNPSLESIIFLSDKYNVKTVLVASMYGNPADLVSIENYCKDNNIFLLDDSAQSFGAKLDGKFLGTFGDAGFFSFSPGKPTAGHMGSFFCSKNSITIKRKKHCLTHFFRWLDFYLNRYNKDKYKLFQKPINLFSRLLLKIVNVYDDDLCKFEKEILGGVFISNLENKFRKKYLDIFEQKFNKNRYFRVLKSLRGDSNPHKFVIIFYNKNDATKFLKYMLKVNISVLNGYDLLTDDYENIPNAKSIDKKVVELPIEDNEEKMNYLFEKVEQFEC